MRLLQTLSTTSESVATNGSFNLGLVDRKVCMKCNGTPTFAFNGNSISLNQVGYYEISGTITGQAQADGTIGISMYVNGVESAGTQVVDQVVENDYFTLNFTKIVRVLPNCCAVQNNSPLVISLVNTGVPTITTRSVLVSITKVE